MQGTWLNISNASALKAGMIVSRKSLRRIAEIAVCSPYFPQMQVKALSCKEETKCESDPETLSSGVKRKVTTRVVIGTQFKSLHLRWCGNTSVPVQLAAFTSGKATLLLKGIFRF